MREERAMNHCLRCNKQCSVNALLCGDCRQAIEQSTYMAAPEQTPGDVSLLATSPHVAVLQPDPEDKNNIAAQMTAPDLVVPSSPPLSTQSLPYTMQANRVEQALHRLHDAARRIAAVEPGDGHKPKFVRLSPIRDVS